MAKKTQRTHKGLKKALNIRNSGSITIGTAGAKHNTGKKRPKFNRNKRKNNELSSGDKNRLKGLIDNI